jgi:hypothetical protein
LEHTTAATEADDVHVPGNGGTCRSHFCLTERENTVVAKTFEQRFNLHQLLKEDRPVTFIFLRQLRADSFISAALFFSEMLDEYLLKLLLNCFDETVHQTAVHSP